MFDNQVFDSWRNKKSDEILSKVDQEKITTEEMLILILKGQTNHFHHMDIEFRQEFEKIDKRFEKMDQRFEKMDDRFERMWNFHRWQIGIIVSLFAGLYFKLFFG
ncbi:MAG: hypothetical protein AB7I27_10150 [Bacteriovoracaceae bacterium]